MDVRPLSGWHCHTRSPTGLPEQLPTDGRHSREGQPSRQSHFLNFGTDEKTDVTAIIPETAFHRWRGGASDIRVLQGRTLRVRGYVRNSNGPSVWVYDPEQIELIMTPPRPESRRS